MVALLGRVLVQKPAARSDVQGAPGSPLPPPLARDRLLALLLLARLDALHALADPVINRFKEAEQRTRVVSELRETINNYMTQASSNDERFSHIEEKDKQSIIEKCATIQKWLEDQSVRQSERPKNVDPVFTAAEVLKKKDEIIYFATPILTKPKPKPKVEPTGTPGQETPKGTETPKAEEQAKAKEDDDLQRAIKLSEEDEAKRNKSIEESNQRSLFDDQAQAYVIYLFISQVA